MRSLDEVIRTTISAPSAPDADQLHHDILDALDGMSVPEDAQAAISRPVAELLQLFCEHKARVEAHDQPRVVGRVAVWVNGRRQSVFDDASAEGVKLAAKGGNWACAVIGNGSGARLLVDGQESDPFDYVAAASPVISPDGRTVIAHVCRGDWADGEHFLWVNSELHGPFEGIGADLAVSDHHWAAPIQQEGGRWRVCQDGVMHEATFDAVREYSLAFSADGNHSQYLARTGSDFYVVVDGVAQGPYGGVRRDSMREGIFSSAGRTTYDVSPAGGPYYDHSKQYYAVLDGQMGPAKRRILRTDWSPDGLRLAVVAREAARALSLSVDGETVRTGLLMPTSCPVWSENSQHVAWQFRGSRGPDGDWVSTRRSPHPEFRLHPDLPMTRALMSPVAGGGIALPALNIPSAGRSGTRGMHAVP